MATDSKAAQSRIIVTRLTPGEAEELADDLYAELRDWTASSTHSRSDDHFEELAMMVDNATFNTHLALRVATFDEKAPKPDALERNCAVMSGQRTQVEHFKAAHHCFECIFCSKARNALIFKNYKLIACVRSNAYLLQRGRLLQSKSHSRQNGASNETHSNRCCFVICDFDGGVC